MLWQTTLYAVPNITRDHVMPLEVLVGEISFSPQRERTQAAPSVIVIWVDTFCENNSEFHALKEQLKHVQLHL